MPSRSLTRRDFLQLSSFFSLGAVLAACGRALPWVEEITSTPAPTPDPNSMETVGGHVSLDGWQADAWTWVKEVRGRINGDCQDLAVRVNGIDFSAERQGQAFSAQVPLNEGENNLVAVCRFASGQEAISEMIHYHERLRNAPVAQIEIALDGETIVLDGQHSRPEKEGGSPIVDHIWSAAPTNPEPLMLQPATGQSSGPLIGEVSSTRLTLLPPQVDGEYTVRLTVKDAAGRQDTSAIYFVVENSRPRIPDYAIENPAWVETAVVYGVIPRLFGSPAFQAITKKLDDLADLGVNALWLAPINVSPPGDYGYAVVDYFELNPAYGTKEDFHRMVQEAHSRGIRVLMDFVPNHSSAQHPYFLDAQERGRESPYYSFYDRDASGQPTHYFDWTHLPNLNYNNPEVERWMLEAFAYWVREFDVDGFRVDVAWGIRQRRPEFWPVWRRELKRIKPDLLLLAEASARDPYYFDNGFDAAYDWTGQLGHWAWELVWDSYKHRLLAYNLDTTLRNRPEGFHPDALIFRFLNNNDTGDRFITKQGEGMNRVATALLLTLPGIPCIYTGDEVGAEYKPYQDPAPLTWEERVPGLRRYFQKLIALRSEIASLHARRWQPVETEPLPQAVYAYLRYGEAGEEPALVVLNFSEEPAKIKLTLPEEFTNLVSGEALIDRLNDEELPNGADGALQIPVPGFTARILVAKPDGRPG